MTNPGHGKQPASLDELLQWRPWWIADPALSLIVAQIDEATRRELVTIGLELHKEILAAHVKADDRALAALSKKT